MRDLRAWSDRFRAGVVAATTERNGMAREIEAADDQPFQIAIRPAITDILGQTALLQLAAYGVDPEVVEEEADDEAA